MSIEEWTNDIHQGAAVETLRQMPDSSVHMAMCSPPYYGLRDYGEDGQIGLEDTLAEYIEQLVAVGDELRRVLRNDGSWWLNLGDTYGGGSIVRSDAEWTRPGDEGYEEAHTATVDGAGRRSMERLGRKNKLLVPHRTAIALQEAGWIVRNDAVWAKPNPMPESVTDRLSTTFEFVFHLTPAPDYYYDLDAIREPYDRSTVNRGNYYQTGRVDKGDTEPGSHTRGGIHDGEKRREEMMHPAGKNPGDVFEVTTKPYPDAHFAVYPPELCEKPIKATAPEQVCAECGAPYEREVEREPGEYDYSERGERVGNGQQASGTQLDTPDAEFKGWTPTCDCDTDATEPGIVLDPFAGAGTTCLVAKRLGRRFIGIDLNPEYVAMAQSRVGVPVDEPDRLRDDENQRGLEAFD